MSNPDITITLGRTGQVVKRGRKATDYTQSSDADNIFLSSKRQRGDGTNWHPGGNGTKVNRNDLRFKLMRKNQSKQRGIIEEQNRMDLRQKLSNNVHPSRSHNILQHRPPEAKGSSLSRQLHPRESADDLYLVHSLRKSNLLHVNGVRSRSPDGFFRTSKGLSPPRYLDELRRVPSTREVDMSREGWPLRNGIAHAHVPEGSIPVKVMAFPQTGKPVTQPAPTSGSLQRNSYVGEESITVSGLLHSLGLGKYAIHFQAEEIDMAALRQMGEKDLKELGIPMGPRKKILLALLPRFKRQPP